MQQVKKKNEFSKNYQCLEPPPPNPLNVLNLLLSKLKAMESEEPSTGEISEVDIELCNKIFYILNPGNFTIQFILSKI